MRVIQPYVATPSVTETPVTQPHRNRFSTARTAGQMPVWTPKGLQTADFADPAGSGPMIKTGVEENRRPGFKDLVDIINPLQHIPLVGVAYRKLTGDDISPTAQFMGGALYGGPIGAAAAMADIAIKEKTGQSVGERFLYRNSDETTLNGAPVTQLAARWKDEPRMAGSTPVWGQDHAIASSRMPTTVVPGGSLSPETNFAMLLNTLSDKTPNIS